MGGVFFFEVGFGLFRFMAGRGRVEGFGGFERYFGGLWVFGRVLGNFRVVLEGLGLFFRGGQRALRGFWRFLGVFGGILGCCRGFGGGSGGASQPDSAAARSPGLGVFLQGFWWFWRGFVSYWRVLVVLRGADLGRVGVFLSVFWGVLEGLGYLEDFEAAPQPAPRRSVQPRLQFLGRRFLWRGLGGCWRVSRVVGLGTLVVFWDFGGAPKLSPLPATAHSPSYGFGGVKAPKRGALGLFFFEGLWGGLRCFGGFGDFLGEGGWGSLKGFRVVGRFWAF